MRKMNYLTAVLILALGVNLNEAKSQVRLTSPFSILATDNNETVRAETALVAESLKKLVTKQVRQTHSRSFLGVITVKDLVNEIIGVTASTASIAIPAPGASETIAILLLTYNWALYKEINANASLTSISAMAIDKLVSDKVMYNVIEPLAKVYEQLGKNVRGLAEVRQLYLPTSLFAEVIPWFEIPDLKILPVWLSFPQFKYLPVDWMVAQSAFDMAVMSLDFARLNPAAGEDVFELYREYALDLVNAIDASEKMDGDDLDQLFIAPQKISEYAEIDEADRLENIYDIKEGLRKKFRGSHADGLNKDYFDGRNTGRFFELFGGAANCLFKDALYGSFATELLWLERMSEDHALSGEDALRLHRLHYLIRESDYILDVKESDNYALTREEKKQGQNKFYIKTCVNRYPNRYLKNWKVPQNYFEAYFSNLPAKLSHAQTSVQKFGDNELKNKFSL